MAEARLVVDRVEVERERLEAVVLVSDPAWLRTSVVPGLPDAVLRALPDMRRHRCECGVAHGVEREISDTETPHLLEHVWLELMALAGSPRDLRGETVWDFSADGPGVFHVRVGFDNESVARAALDGAVSLVNRALLGEELVDVESVVEQIRAARAG